MKLETFSGPDLARALAVARAAAGEEAVIVRTRGPRETGAAYEVVVARSADVAELRARLATAKPPAPRAHPEDPYVVALVGPAGAGKTTTAIKLALHEAAFGTRRVGLLTLDTYRAAAVEQIHMYAEVADLPLEVAYQPAEAEAALHRMRDRDVVIVDTPGRNPPRGADLEWRTLLKAIAPDEVHFVVPASIRADVACALRDTFRWGDLTHTLLTKLDEVPACAGVADLAQRLALPARWITDGQEIPLDLHHAETRILGALGAIVPDAALRRAG